MLKRIRTWCLCLAALAVTGFVLSSCGGGGGGGGGVSGPKIPDGPVVADLDVDANRDGTVTNTPDDDDFEDQWSTTHGAVFYYNLDDDNSLGNEDYKTTNKAGADADDLAVVIVRAMPSAPAGSSITVTSNPEAHGNIRIYRYGGAAWNEVSATGASVSIPASDIRLADVVLAVEGRGRLSQAWNGQLTLTLEIRDAQGNVLDSDAVIMRQAPPLFATNLWIPSEVQVVNIPGGGSNNAALVAALTSITNAGGMNLRLVPGASYSNDRWIQDSHEPAVEVLPSQAGPRRFADLVYQCYRLRPIDDFIKPALLGPDFGFQQRFGAVNSSLNYGGNIEVIPPHNGRAWGRMLIGGGNGDLIGTTTPATDYMDNANRQYFDANPIQGTHVQATTEWLGVGHIDEYTMFIPAPNTARGYVCLIASPMRAWNQIVALNQQPGGGALQVFPGRTSGGWQTTVSAIAGNGPLGTLQQQVQARIDQGRAEIKAGSDLTDADFIELPVLFEPIGFGYLAAYNPGVVNLVCLPAANGTTYLAIPDPEGPNPGTGDIWREDILSQLAPLQTGANPYDVTFVDVFYSYHALLGEAHCGTNTVRIPPQMDWWDQ